jgi:hypothetical protein
MPTEPKKRAVYRKSTARVIEKADDATEDEALAGAVMDGISSNAITITAFTEWAFGETSLMACIGVLKDKVRTVHEGDLREAETLLISQASALNVIFADLARRSALIMSEHADAAERYLRLALKAQNQCRTTVETLAAIKNPPMIFAKQANIAHGHQQVNNCGAIAASHARAGKNEIEQNELLEVQHGSEKMDFRATDKPVRVDSAMEALGEVHGCPHTRGKGSGST